MAAPSPALAWASMRASRSPERVQRLTELALDILARNPQLIRDLRCTDEHLAVALLRRIMKNNFFDYRLACVFRDAGRACEWISRPSSLSSKRS